MMVELGIRGVHHPKPSLAHLQAVVDIIEGHAEVLLVEAAEGLEKALSGHQAGARDRREVLAQTSAPVIAPDSTPESLLGMAGHPAYAEDDATMLQRIVWVPQASSDNPHVLLEHEGDHLIQPAWCDNFCIVVEEADQFAAGLADAVIVDSREVERGAWVLDDAQTSCVALLQP